MTTIEEICRRTGACERLDRSEITPLLESEDATVRLLARRCMAVQDLLASADHLAAVLAERDWSSMDDLKRLLGVAGLAADADMLVRAGLEAGLAAAQRGEDALALEMLQVACGDDIQRGIRELGDTARADEIARTYDAVAQRQVPFAPARPTREHTGPLRIGYVVPNLVDHFNAPSQRIANFARYHDPQRFAMHVYTSEVLSIRKVNHYFRRQLGAPTLRRAPQILHTLAERGVPCFETPRDVDFLDAAKLLATRVRDDRLDLVAYQSSLACPIECVVANWRPAPVQVNINVGVPMYVEGIDCTTYFMKQNHEREAEYFVSRGRRSLFLDGGIDLEIQLPPPPTKTQIGVCEDTVLLVSVGNHLEKRMSDEFVACISRVLQANPRCAYLVIGIGSFARQKKLFHEAGVLKRVAFAGGHSDVRNVIRVADVYVNEFPEGGAQSVMEAMAAGLPAVAMHYSNQHLHCCGAEYVGPEMTVASRDFEGYVDLVNRLVRDAAFRRERAEAARRRVEELYSFRRCVERFETLYTELHEHAAREAA